jgi:hypothetical protein
MIDPQRLSGRFAEWSRQLVKIADTEAAFANTARRACGHLVDSSNFGAECRITLIVKILPSKENNGICKPSVHGKSAGGLLFFAQACR